jgi:hypothetical protein
LCKFVIILIIFEKKTQNKTLQNHKKPQMSKSALDKTLSIEENQVDRILSVSLTADGHRLPMSLGGDVELMAIGPRSHTNSLIEAFFPVSIISTTTRGRGSNGLRRRI